MAVALAINGLAASHALADPARFIRGVNLNGPALSIDGHAWAGKDAPWLTADSHRMENQKVALIPNTDPARTRMIRSSVWGNNVTVTLKDLPAGSYRVFLYAWEDNNAVNFRITLNGQQVLERYDSRSAGHWERLGPWPVELKTPGQIALTANGGDANLSGVEIWSGDGDIPAPGVALTLAKATPEGLEFFEKRVRPLLVQHCYECHSAGAEELHGGLRVDSRAGMLRGGDTQAAVVPGDIDSSLLIAAVQYREGLQMPPDGKLAAREIEDLEAWVRMGAPDPRTEELGNAKKRTIDFEAGRKFWSFQPVVDRPPPAVKDAAWPRTDLDRFVLARLEEAGLTPAPDVDKRTLIRRLTFDLTGLPPTPEEIASFLADTSPQAYAQLVDRLLASPHYGERWGRHWLDVVRYADTAGCNSDFPVTSAWRYRNWVIDSLNADKPYDQFLREQIAGDLLPAADEKARQAQIVATGYLAIGRRFGSLADEFHLTIEDNLDNIGKVALGLSVSCARCHDHKFDPIPTADYYGLYGILGSTRYAFPGTEIPPQPKDFVPLVSADEWKNVIEPAERQIADLEKQVGKLEKAESEAKKQLEGAKKKLDAIKPDEAEAAKDKDAVKDAAKAEFEAAEQKHKAALAELDSAKKELQDARSKLPKYGKAYAVAEGKPANAKIQRKGDPRQLGDEVPRHFLSILGGQTLPAQEKGSGRLQLAGWLTDSANPLMPRVMVNRLWQYHFGEALVRTPNDFGARGLPPTHPELLDWLATRFRQARYSLKAMHRLIVTSRAYQMAAIENPRYAELDSRNERLWTFPRRRLSAEELRDALLAVSGGLDRTPGEGHAFPAEPFRFTQHNPFLAVYETNHRSVYLMQQRLKKHPFLDVFDGADPNVTTAVRPLNTTALQALYAMNDPFVHRQAEVFAARLLREVKEDDARIERAHQLALGRAPSDTERRLASEYLDRVSEALKAAKTPEPKLQTATWASYARALFASNEFAFVD